MRNGFLACSESQNGRAGSFLVTLDVNVTHSWCIVFATVGDHPYQTLHQILTNSLDVVQCALVPALSNGLQIWFFTPTNSILHRLFQDPKQPIATWTEIWWRRWVRSSRNMFLPKFFSDLCTILFTSNYPCGLKNVANPCAWQFVLFYCGDLGAPY
jgi:hypothetical protein